MIALSETTEQLARVLARKAGRTPDEVISQALEERARAAGIPVPSARPKTPEEKIAAMKATSDRCAALPILVKFVFEGMSSPTTSSPRRATLATSA